MSLPAADLQPTTDLQPAAVGDFATRAGRAADVLRAGRAKPVVVHTAAGAAAQRSAGASLRPVAAGSATALGSVAAVVAAVIVGAGGDLHATVPFGWALLGLLGVLSGPVAGAAVYAAVAGPAPAGMLLHGHAAAGYTTITEGPARLRELGAAETVVGAVEELLPVAEHLAAVLAALRTELVAAGDPAGDTTGTPAHEQLLAIAGEVTALVDLARQTRQAVAAHAHAALPTGSLATVADQVAAEGAAARAALDRLG